MSGAPRITAAAALRSGAGRVTLITRPEYAALANLTMPELMCIGIDAAAEIPDSLESATVIAIGPGLGSDTWAESMMQYALRKSIPLVMDADGLNYLAKHKTTRTQWILTPHPAEAARLLGTSTAHVQTDRTQAVLDLQKMYHGVIVLKGAGSLVASATQAPRLFKVGNPGMASPGMGDCLTGIIAALIAQHLPLHDAANLAVWVHGMAGNMAAKSGGERGLLASDLLPYIRELLNHD